MRALYICVVAVWGIALARIDFAQHRLPDRLTLPAIPGAIALVAQVRHRAGCWCDRARARRRFGLGRRQTGRFTGNCERGIGDNRRIRDSCVPRGRRSCAHSPARRRRPPSAHPLWTRVAVRFHPESALYRLTRGCPTSKSPVRLTFGACSRVRAIVNGNITVGPQSGQPL